LNIFNRRQLYWGKAGGEGRDMAMSGFHSPIVIGVWSRYGYYVGISCTSGHTGPHGYIDLMMYSKDFPETMVAIEEFKGHVSGGIEAGRLSATSVKTMDTFYSNGSDRQCVIEILALAEVLLTSNPDLWHLLKPPKVRFVYQQC